MSHLFKGRTIGPAIIAFCLLAGNSSHAALLAYEPFTNAPGTAIIGSGGGFGFSGTWQDYNGSLGVATNTGYGLTYTDGASNTLTTTGGAGFFQGLVSSNASMQPIRLLAAGRGTNGVDGGTTWISFLTVRQGPTVAGGNPLPRGANMAHDIHSGGVQKLAAGNSSGAAQNTVGLIPLGQAANLKPTSVPFSQTNLIVVRINHNAGGANDDAYLFLNPNLSSEPALDAANTNTLGGFDFSFDRVRAFAGGNNGASQPYAELVVDEYRIGETFADVTPHDGGVVTNPPAPTSLLITNVVLISGNVVLRGNGGDANGGYQLLRATNVALPIAQWSVVGSNNFDNAGNFVCSNSAAGGASQFYRVRSGTNGVVSPVAPGITGQPQDLAVAVGQNALFSVTATGTATLKYQWFFNTNTALTFGTGAALTITNAQLTNAGKYSAMITNLGGATNSVFATLTVTSVPPAISIQPSNQTVNVGQNATFSVGVTGTAPLAYQWFFNTNTLLGAATNATCAVTNAQLTNAGKYHVVVANMAGTNSSGFATLTVNSNLTPPDFSMVGFATLSGFSSNSTLLAGGTTGGAGGPLVLCSNVTQLRNYAQVSNQALRILIIADINMSSLANNDNPQAGLPMGKITINNNKTIYSTNGATISRGSFHIVNKNNVIIRNLKFRDMFFENAANDPGYDDHDWDYIRVDTSHHVWVDHCDFEQVYDGMVDVKDRGDYVTVSWCVFRNQKKCNLIGSDDGATADRGHLNVTFHHNWYYQVDERTPRMRFGNAHVFNMYYSDAIDSGKCIQSTAEAATLVENCYFIRNQGGCYPTVFVNGGLPGKALKVVNCTILSSPSNHGFQQTNAATFSFNAPFVTNQPPYNYTLDPTDSVANIVTNWAGTSTSLIP